MLLSLIFLAVLGFWCSPAFSEDDLDTPSMLSWTEMPALPDELGVAGPFVGVHDNALIIAGGTNFSRPVWENDKLWGDAIHVLTEEGNKYVWKDGGRLPRSIAYGASVSTPNGVLCMGGKDVENTVEDVFLLQWDQESETIRVVPGPPLPAPCAYGDAALIDDIVFFTGGQTGLSLDTATNSFWSLDLSKWDDTGVLHEWQELWPMPCPTRSCHIAAVQHNGDHECLYVISGWRQQGGEYEFLTDVWEYSPVTGEWRQRADAPRCVMGGTGIGAGQSYVFILGGTDGSLLEHANELKDDHPGFVKEALAYDTIANSWISAGQIPANQIMTDVVEFDGAIVLPTGEIRPRVRSNKVWRVKLIEQDRGFGAFNYAVLLGFLLVVIGVYFATKNRSIPCVLGRHRWQGGCQCVACGEVDDANGIDESDMSAECGSIVAANSLDIARTKTDQMTDPKKRLNELQLLANEQGDAGAQCDLGQCYYEGNGVAQDHAEAAKWFRLAAEQGHADAQCNLGTMYSRGRELPQDGKEAYKWYRQAAEQGHSKSQLELGKMLLVGDGIAMDHAEAANWLRLAATQGVVDAQVALGMMLAMGEDIPEGEGIPENEEEAIKWLRLAADSGDKTAEEALADLSWQHLDDSADEVHPHDAVENRTPLEQQLDTTHVNTTDAQEKPPSSEAVEEAEQHSEKGVAATQAQKFVEAASHFRKASELDPSCLRHRLSLATALTLAGKLDEADEEFARLIKDHPEDKDIERNYRLATTKFGLRGKGLRLSEIEAKVDESKKLFIANGNEHTDESLRLLEDVLAMDPMHQHALRERGIVHEIKGEYEAAIPLLRKAIDNAREPCGSATVERFRLDMMDHVALCLRKIDQYQEAIEVWEQVLESPECDTRLTEQTKSDIRTAKECMKTDN